MKKSYERETWKSESWSRDGLSVEIKMISLFDAQSLDMEDAPRESPGIQLIISEGEAYGGTMMLSSMDVLREIAEILAHATHRKDILSGLCANEPEPEGYE